MSPSNLHDLTRCPLCGQANLCAMAQQNDADKTDRNPDPAASRCWCLQASFTDSARAALAASEPFEARGLNCICARCAAQP